MDMNTCRRIVWTVLKHASTIHDSIDHSQMMQPILRVGGSGYIDYYPSVRAENSSFTVAASNSNDSCPALFKPARVAEPMSPVAPVSSTCKGVSNLYWASRGQDSDAPLCVEPLRA